MKPATISRIAQAIQLLKLDGFEDYTNVQLANASGIAPKTISRNIDLIVMLDFALRREGYQRCQIKVA